MGLSLEDFTPRGVPGFRCGVKIVLDQLEPDDREVLETALKNPAVQHAAVERVLKREGYTVRALTIGRHRRGVCDCAE